MCGRLLNSMKTSGPLPDWIAEVTRGCRSLPFTVSRLILMLTAFIASGSIGLRSTSSTAGTKSFHWVQCTGLPAANTGAGRSAVVGGEAMMRGAGDWDLIVSFRQAAGTSTVFAGLPRLIAFLRCAMDIRNVDVTAASKAGVLVTQASAGFVSAVAEMVLGFLVDLSRGITRSTIEYRAGRVPQPQLGRELKGATLAVIGYGA